MYTNTHTHTRRRYHLTSGCIFTLRKEEEKSAQTYNSCRNNEARKMAAASSLEAQLCTRKETDLCGRLPGLKRMTSLFRHRDIYDLQATDEEFHD